MRAERPRVIGEIEKGARDKKGSQMCLVLRAVVMNDVRWFTALPIHTRTRSITHSVALLRLRFPGVINVPAEPG